jgi:RND family efflux transporter MFP subunit
MLAVTEQQQVHRGTVIAEIAADELRAALAEAHAQLTEADADTAWLTMEQQRNTRLVQTNSVPRQTLDKVTHDLAAARARHAVAEATVHRLSARLAKTRVTAPIDGTIVSRPVEVGDVVGPGTPLVTIANLRRRRVEAEVDEYDIGRVRLGAPVTITTEGGETQAWRGTVEEIPDMVVPRRLAPQDPGRPSAMKVLLVKVALPQTAPLKLGQRVELAIDTQSSRGVETAPRPAN